MAGSEAEDLESFHQSILTKYESFGISRLTPSEICLTLLSPSWEYFFFKAKKSTWLSVVGAYKPTLVSHLKSATSETQQAKDQESAALRQQAGKKFLELLDNIAITHSGSVPEPSLKDDAVIERLKDALGKKGISLANLLLKNDANHDGQMSKSEFINSLEELLIAPAEIVALIRIAGYRPGVDSIPIAGFSDFLSKRSDDRKKEEYHLFTKVLSAFNTFDKNLNKVFNFLDTNKDGVITLEELRQGLIKMNVNLTLAECKEVFTVIDKDRSGSISLDELKKRLNTLSSGGHEVKKNDSSKVSGNLEVNILKGQKFKAGAKVIKVKFGGMKFESAAVNDANPEWKFKNVIEVRDQAIQDLAREIELEVFIGTKSEGKAVIHLSDIRNTDVYKGKLDITAGKQVHGVVLAKCTWTGIESTSSSSEIGSLSFSLIRGENITSDILVSSGTKRLILSTKTLGQTFYLEKLSKSSSQPIKLQKLPDGASTDLLLTDIISEDKRTPYEIVLEKTKLFIQIIWEDFDEEDEKEDRAATKIQAAWRGYLVRHSRRIKNERLMVYKKAAGFEKRRFMLAVFQDKDSVEIETHLADSTQIGIETIVSVSKFPIQDVPALLSQLTLKPDMKLGSVLEKPHPIRGDLQIQLINVKNLPPSLLYFTLGNSSALISTSASSDPATLPGLSFKSIPPELNLKVLQNSNKSLIAETKVFWTHSINTPEIFTSNSIIYLNEQSNLLLRFKWDPLEDISKEEQAAVIIQKHWRAKREREEMKLRTRKNSLIGRKGVFKENRVYLVSVVEEKGEWVVQLHPADNPQVPLFEVIDSVRVAIAEDVDAVFARIGVEGGKLKLS